MILFSADWHIKLGQKNVPVQWQIDRYKQFFSAIENIENIHLHIVGGDIFDKMPSLEELLLFLEFIKGTKYDTIIYDGNHEATKRGVSFLPVLRPWIETVNPKIKVISDLYHTDTFDIIPYCKLKQFEKDKIFTEKAKILFTHVRGEIPPHVKPEVDLTIFEPWDIVFAGDLHSHENTQGHIVYPGSPMTTSFHRNKTKNGVVIINEQDLSYAFLDLDLPKLLKITVDDSNKVVESDSVDHIIYEVEGDMDTLLKVSGSNIEKKLLRREQEVSLILTPDMTLSEEVEEYLRFILQLKETTIESVMKVLHDNIKDA